MIRSIDFDLCLVQHPPLAGMILICRVVIPERTIVRVNSPDAGLDDRIAARKAWKFRYVNSRALEGAATNAGRVHDRIVLGMADDLHFLVYVKESLVIIMHTARQSIEACG